MADLKKTIDIILNGEDNVSRHIRNVHDTMGRLGSKFGAVAKPAAGAAVAITAVGTAVAALVGAGLKEAYGQAVQFESAMVDLEKVLGDHPEELTAAKEAAMGLSAQYGISSGKIVDSIANWVQAGYGIEEATRLAEESIALMYTSELDAASATEILTKIMKGFGLEVGEARGKLDAINEISNNYGANTQQLSEALARVAPAAESMGFSLEEMAAIMTPAIEKFQDGERVGTAFKTVLGNLVSPTGRIEEGLAKLGITQEELNTELTGGKERFEAVKEALASVDDETKVTAATMIAGKEHFTKFLGAMKDAEYNAEIYTRAVDSAGSMTEELAAKLESADKQIDRWDTGWENLSITIGNQFKAAATEAVKGGTDIVNALRDSIEGGELDEVFDVLEENLNAFGEELKAIADAMPEALEGINWSAVKSAIETAGEAISGLFGGLDLTKAEDLERFIQDIVDTGANLIEFSGNAIVMIEKLGGAFVFVAEVVNGFFEILRDIDGPVDFFQTAIGLLIGLLEGFYEMIAAVPGMGGIMQGPIESLRGYGETVAAMTMETEKAADKVDKMKKAINDLPSKKKTEIELSPSGAMADFINRGEGIDLPINVEAKADRDEIEKQILRVEGTAQSMADAIHGDEGVKIPVNVDDKGSLEKTEKRVDKLAEKKLEIQADIKEAEIEKDIAHIKAVADTVQTSVEWDAKVDIAQVKASAEQVKAIMDSVDTAIESTGQSIGDAMSALSEENLDTLDKWAIQDYFDAEAKRRAEAFEQQKQLLEQQVKLNDLKIDRMESGDPMMQISVDDSVEPALKLVMMNILELMQTEFNESASQFLMGWESVSP